MFTVAFPHPPASGGPGSFQKRFEAELKNRGYKIIYAYDTDKADIVFVVGGTKKLIWLLKNKFNKIPIIYRLDGINWIHRKRKIVPLPFIKSEIQNIICKIIHKFLSSYIVYQSIFVKEWWKSAGWRKSKNYEIINNGIDIEEFRPYFNDVKTKPHLICLEGYVDYTPYAIDLINFLSQKLEIKFEVYGDIKFKEQREKLKTDVNYIGRVAFNDLPKTYQNTIYLSLDINAGCPNTVIEALACGSPVVGFDTGSLKELVPEGSGIIVPYGGDPWKLETPNYQGLADAIAKIAENYEYYSINARKTAEEKYNINMIVDKYISVIQKAIHNK